MIYGKIEGRRWRICFKLKQMIHFEAYIQCELVPEAGLKGEGGTSRTEDKDRLVVGMTKAENSTVLWPDRLSGSISDDVVFF